MPAVIPQTLHRLGHGTMPVPAPGWWASTSCCCSTSTPFCKSTSHLTSGMSPWCASTALSSWVCIRLLRGLGLAEGARHVVARAPGEALPPPSPARCLHPWCRQCMSWCPQRRWSPQFASWSTSLYMTGDGGGG